MPDPRPSAAAAATLRRDLEAEAVIVIVVGGGGGHALDVAVGEEATRAELPAILRAAAYQVAHDLTTPAEAVTGSRSTD